MYRWVGTDPGYKRELRVGKLQNWAPLNAPVHLELLNAVVYSTTGNHCSRYQARGGEKGMHRFDLTSAVCIHVKGTDCGDVRFELTPAVQLVYDDESTGAHVLHEGQETRRVAALTVLRRVLALADAAIQRTKRFDRKADIVAMIGARTKTERCTGVGVECNKEPPGFN